MPPPFPPCFCPPSCLPPLCQASWFMPPTMPGPLPLTQRVEGAGNTLCLVPCTLHAFPFAWHEEGCPSPPPLPLVHTPHHTFPPHLASTRREGWNPPTPQPPVPCPVPCMPPPFACENHMQRGGVQGEGPGLSSGPTSTTTSSGEHHHRCGSSAACSPGWGSACKWKGGGVEKGLGGGREP